MESKMAGAMEKPECLISSDSEGKLCVQKKAKEILDGISNPVVVVSVVGLYRTGKSYLMNRLAGKQEGFALGSTIESETKGIWMWCVPHPNKPDHTLVLLDTEGLGDVHKGNEKHDTWIFCLAVLLSSTLVYNSLGVIDNMALEKLHYVTKLTEKIKVKAHMNDDYDDSAEFMRIFPSFIWAVRDFTLELKRGDQTITADEYLEGALKLKKGNTAYVENFNLPRRFLRHFFAERRCFVFPRPADVPDLKNMEKLPEEKLDPLFLQQSKEFCKHVHSSAKPKTVPGGRTVIGSVLGGLAEVYVEAIRRGDVPCLENAVETLAQIQNEKAVEQTQEVYMKEVLKSIRLPMDPAELSRIHRETEQKAVKFFISMSFNDTKQEAQLKLMGKIQAKYEDLCYQNQVVCLEVCREELNRVFAPLEEGLRDNSFIKKGGYKKYRDTLRRLTAEYREITHTQHTCEEVLTEYLKKKEEYGNMILAADLGLTEADREQEVIQLKREAGEQMQKVLEEQIRLQEQALSDQERTYEENVTRLLERMERERERAQEDNKRVLEAKLKEQEALIQEGFDEKAEQMKKEIKGLKEEMENKSRSKQSTFSKVVETFGTACLFIPGIASKVVGIGATLLSKFL
ncbi:guanylate-binding protein 1-like [Astyanax mexicanus]|uniref:guanylate-binding protein 1-like n=1 Tax=Astyanax mexicanus TaxID=7994 RepID=UPI0020CAD662|nr:guanylate-binding protein 1-like [Astyanax mexicanus]